MATLLNEPYCPPVMIYEKKQVAAPERAFLTKSAAVRQSGGKAQTLRIVKEALALQEAKHKQMLAAKEEELIRHQEMLIQQKERMLEQERLKKDPNVIQITELQKLAQMDVADKYSVLEFLVKELIGMRKEMQPPNFYTAFPTAGTGYDMMEN